MLFIPAIVLLSAAKRPNRRVTEGFNLKVRPPEAPLAAVTGLTAVGVTSAEAAAAAPT